jgi:hypothetical protein
MTKEEFAEGLSCNFFDSSRNMEQAYEFVQELAKSSDYPHAVYTAVHVMLNAVAKEIPNLA